MKQRAIFAEKEVTLMLGETTGANIQASLAHAGQIAKFNRLSTVLYINTVQTERKFSESVRKSFSGSKISGDAFGIDDRKYVHVINSPLGELHKLREKIEGMIWSNCITTVIINSWEFASRNSRFREDLIFLIKHLLEGNPDKEATYPFDPQTVIIYGEKPTQSPVAGKIQRGGYGKLSGLASKVFFTDANGELQNYETESTKMMEKVMKKAKRSQKKNEQSQSEAEFIIDGIEYPSEDEEGISSDERHERFVNRMRAIGRRDQRIKEGKSEVRSPKSEVGDSKSKVKEKASEATIDNRPSTIDLPVTSIEELRKTPVEISRMPIHLNSYSPDKAPIASPQVKEDVLGVKIKK